MTTYTAHLDTIGASDVAVLEIHSDDTYAAVTDWDIPLDVASSEPLRNITGRAEQTLSDAGWRVVSKWSAVDEGFVNVIERR